VKLRYLVDLSPPAGRWPVLPPDNVVSYVPLEAVWPDDRFDPTRWINFEGDPGSYNPCENGDVLVPKVSPTFSHGRVAVAHGLANGRGLATSEVFVLRPREPRSARFIKYRLLAIDFRSAGEAAQTGVAGLKRVSASFVGNVRVDEMAWQRRHEIAELLDREVSRVRAARDRLAALADRALEPALARAEQAWTDQPLGKIGYRFEVQLGKKLYENRIEHGTAKPYLRIANVYWDRFALDDVKVMNFEGHEAAFYALRPGDLLVCEGRGLGRSAVWDGQIEPCFFQMSLNRVRSRGLDSTRWVMWCLRVLNRRGTFIGDAPGVPHVTAEQLRATRIPLPSPEDQHRLVAEIDAEADRARRLSGLAGRLDERLAEYSDALITAAVHGRLDPARVSDAELDERLHAATEDLVR
jgi:type I restriction enzyme S subunit